MNSYGVMVGADVNRCWIGNGAEQGFDTLLTSFTANWIATIKALKDLEE